MVDSNTQWISITQGGVPVSAGDVYIRRAEFENEPDYLQVPFWALRGLYSRKGQFYRPYIFFPELNWPVFINWVLTA